MNEKRTVYRACNLCEAICGIAIDIEDGAVRSIRGDENDPFSRGHVCPKALALADIQNDPDRLVEPLARRGADWVPISWNEAFDRVERELKRVQDESGRDAVASYLGNPTVHNLGAMLFAPAFVKALGSRNRYSATSVDQLPHHLASAFMYGHPLLLPVPDIDRTGLLLLLGSNPLASNGSMMTAPGYKRRLEALRRRGGSLVVVDPRRTETAAIADRHLAIRPGGDAFLLLGLLHAIFAAGLARPGRLADFSDGLERLQAAVAGFPPARVAAAAGVEAEAIEELARAFATAPAAVCHGRLGACTQEFGGVNLWLVNALNAVTGNLDRPGGAMFATPAVDPIRLRRDLPYRVRFNRWTSRVRGLPESSGELPVAALAEEILTPGPGQVRALVTVAGNPVLSTPDGRRLDRALASLEFMVAVDFYLNETTRHAHVILPPTPPLEREHYDLVFNLLAVRDTAKFSPAVFAPRPGALDDWQILLELRRRLESRGLKRMLAARARAAIERRLGPIGMLDRGLGRGPYGARSGARGRHRLSVANLRRRHPHGVDLGPLKPRLPERLMTPNRRVQLAPEPFVADLERVAARLDGPPAAGELLLVGRRHLASNNSWMHNYERLVRGRDRCTALMHPDDAERLGLADGQRARLSSRVGTIELAVELSERMRRGVVSVPHGWGHDRPGARLSVAGRRPGASVNDLTDAERIDRLSGNAALNGLPVRVTAAAG